MQNSTSETIRGGVFHVIFMILIGVMTAFFVGFGVNAFYPSPTMPEYPASAYSDPYPDVEADSKAAKVMDEYNAQYTTYQGEKTSHDRVATLIVAGISVIVLILGFYIARFVMLIGDGILLGGVFTLIYAIILSSSANAPKVQFAVAAVGLVAIIAIAYFKFVRPKESAS